MKIIFSIIFNAFILYALTYFLNTKIETWIAVAWEPQIYIIWWIILWIINFTIRPILKILSLPLYLIFLWLVVLLINWVILWLFDHIINNVLIMPWLSYSINWTVNFIIAVAIFTILNMFYTLIFSKK